MPDYKNGKIYKIWSPSTGLTYFGSTCQILCQRLSEHRRDMRMYEDTNKKWTSSFIVLEQEDTRIELVEDFPCERREQLAAREGKYIKTNECVNKQVAGRTIAEWYQDNKEKKKKYYEDNKEKIKNYYEDNKEQINERAKQKIKCQCGTYVTKRHIRRHERSKKHLKYLESLESDTDTDTDTDTDSDSD